MSHPRLVKVSARSKPGRVKDVINDACPATLSSFQHSKQKHQTQSKNQDPLVTIDFAMVVIFQASLSLLHKAGG